MNGPHRDPGLLHRTAFADATPSSVSRSRNELGRQRDEIELIASENIVSRAVLEAQGSVLTNKYAEGYPGKRYYGGCQFVDVAENAGHRARQAAVRLRLRQRPAALRQPGQPGACSWRCSSPATPSSA